MYMICRCNQLIETGFRKTEKSIIKLSFNEITKGGIKRRQEKLENNVLTLHEASAA